MLTRNHHVLTSFGFIFALFLLLLNDFLLKDLYGNWFTGKLSDFSGLFVFALFWSSFLPKYQKLLFWLIAALFVFWKSHYSQPLIDLWNNSSILIIHRTVDYSDLIALTILPLAYLFNSRDAELLRFNIKPFYPMAIAAFAFGATSHSTNVKIESEFEFPYPKDTLTQKLQTLDSLNNGQGLVFSDNNSDTVKMRIPSNFCFGRFDAIMFLEQMKDSTSGLTLLSIEHRCPEEKGDKSELTKEFKKTVIDKLKKSL